MNSRVFAITAIQACLALGYAGAARADEARPPSEEARRHFRAGISLLEDPEGERFEEAYAEFKVAYDISKSPKVLGNIGLCAMKLERDGEAIEAYERYLAEVSDIDPEEKAQITHDLETLKTAAVHLSVTTARQKVVLVDVRRPVQGAAVRNQYEIPGDHLELLIHPGHHSISVRTGNNERDRDAWDFSAAGGGSVSHHFALLDAPAVQDQNGQRTVLPWVVLGAGGAALTAAGITGAVALGKTRDLQSACPNDVCTTTQAKSDLHSAQTMVTVTDALFIGGTVLAVAGGAWLLWPTGKSRADVRVGAMCSGTGCFGTAGGAF